MFDFISECCKSISMFAAVVVGAVVGMFLAMVVIKATVVAVALTVKALVAIGLLLFIGFMAFEFAMMLVNVVDAVETVFFKREESVSYVL